MLEAARLYLEDIDADDREDLWAIAQAGIADAKAGRFIETEAEAMHQRTMAKVRASLASDPA